MLAGALVFLSWGCTMLWDPVGRLDSSVPDGYKRVGVYREEKKRTRYFFRKNRHARRLAKQVRHEGHEAIVRRLEVKGKTYHVVYMKRREPRRGELAWPARPAEPFIQYIGELRNGVRLARDEAEEKSSFLGFLFDDTDAPSPIPYPKGVAVDEGGIVYVSHDGGISAFDMAKNTRERVLTGGTPAGIAAGAGGRMFVADPKGRKVLVFRDGTREGHFGEGVLEKPFGLALDAARSRLYVSDAGACALFAFDLEGNVLFRVDSPSMPGSTDRFGAPAGVAVDTEGNIYLVDQGGAKVNVYTSEGTFERSLGGRNNAPGYFVRPKGVAVDGDGNIYVTDAAFDNVQVFDRQGRLLLVVGSGGMEPGEFNLPTFVHVDARNRIYISDLGNHRVQVMKYVGTAALEAPRRGGDTVR
jgi:DNA-binding beta-propeller fold protein YncE